MAAALEQFIEGLQQASTLDDLQSKVFELRDLYEVEHVVYHSVNASGGQYAALTYGDAWVDRYITEGYERIDPVVMGCFQRFHPVDWRRLDWSGKVTRDFMDEAKDAGVGNQGYTVPIRGPSGQFAMFTVSHGVTDEKWTRFTEVHTRDLILSAHYLNQKALEIESGGTTKAPGRALSPRERDALTMLALGYSRAQAAESLEISEHTLRVYIEGARYKLGAMNTTHAVALALAQGRLVF
ncbi:LuxR family transcriptional regulator [Vannielia litorea]|uniref:helix-turn-helix transcriptional regulator n=1 Tax=Vannielia TaxID=2813041 RepID=UPI001C983963|nr:LuxR family transcriptional regulator [Vannielia litorea]MBY6048268.1 LuxR family transcriptional regulator [Vannielia litorea]MBY6075682.1 LuxR family transcriptional regulator [Vannielia litorea]MBY6151830.1 LuxR family transcriptional regulator [Vannielia litorea]